jgi:hypothetical protein
MSMPPESRTSKPDSLDFIFCFISASLALWVGYVSRNIIDIGLYDESNYLHNGIEIAQGKLPDPSGAPLYACWYFLLNLISGEPVSAYYLNYAVLSATTTALVYIFLRVYQISRVSSLAWSTVFMMSSANIPAWPKVSNLALVFILFAAIASAFFHSIGQRISIAMIVTAIVTFLRPEFAFGWIIAFLSGLYYMVHCLFKFRRFPKGDFYIFFLSIAFSLGLLAIFGNPLQGSRSFMAFGQHYSLNYVKWHNLEINPWTNWNNIVAKSFGDADSIGSALRANPVAFFSHLASNCIRLPRELANLFIPWLAILKKANILAFKGVSFRLIGVAFLSAILILYLIGAWRLKPSGFRQGLAKMYTDINRSLEKLSFLMLFVLSIPFGISVLIHPRAHYLVMLLPVILLVGAIFTDVFIGTPLVIMGSARKKKAAFIYLGFAIFIAVTTSGVTSPRPTYEIINALKTLHLQPPLNILEASGGFNIYLGSGFKRIAEYDKSKSESCSAFFERKSVGLVLVDKNLLNDTRFKDDADCQRLKDAAFLDSDSASGVAVLEVEPDNRYKRIMFINR